MVKKRGLPSLGELVICKVEKLNPHSAFLSLVEYQGIEGMVHISEISSGWIRDIRDHIKAGQTVVAKVMAVDGRNVGLSIKRVDESQMNNKTREYNLELKAEKLLEIVAKKMGKTLESAYEEVGYLLQDKFGSMHEGFKRSITHSIVDKGIPQEWAVAIKEVAEKNIEQKEFEFRAKLMIKTFKPDGISTIKSLLGELEKKGYDVRYIAAPEYLVKYKTKNAKLGRKNFTSALEKLSGDAQISFEIVE